MIFKIFALLDLCLGQIGERGPPDISRTLLVMCERLSVSLVLACMYVPNGSLLLFHSPFFVVLFERLLFVPPSRQCIIIYTNMYFTSIPPAGMIFKKSINFNHKLIPNLLRRKNNNERRRLRGMGIDGVRGRTMVAVVAVGVYICMSTGQCMVETQT